MALNSTGSHSRYVDDVTIPQLVGQAPPSVDGRKENRGAERGREAKQKKAEKMNS